MHKGRCEACNCSVSGHPPLSVRPYFVWDVLQASMPQSGPQRPIPVWHVKPSPGKLAPGEVLGNWGRPAASFCCGWLPGSHLSGAGEMARSHGPRLPRRRAGCHQLPEPSSSLYSGVLWARAPTSQFFRLAAWHRSEASHLWDQLGQVGLAWPLSI